VAKDNGSHLGGGTSSGGESSSWPFSGSDYISSGEDANSLRDRLQVVSLIKDNVVGLLTIIGGLAAAAGEAVPNAIATGLDGVRSFGVDFIDHLFGLPQLTIEQGFSAAASDIAGSGLAGMAAGTVLVGASIFTVAIGVNAIVQ